MQHRSEAEHIAPLVRLLTRKPLGARVFRKRIRFIIDGGGGRLGLAWVAAPGRSHSSTVHDGIPANSLTQENRFGRDVAMHPPDFMRAPCSLSRGLRNDVVSVARTERPALGQNGGQQLAGETFRHHVCQAIRSLGDRMQRGDIGMADLDGTPEPLAQKRERDGIDGGGG